MTVYYALFLSLALSAIGSFDKRAELGKELLIVSLVAVTGVLSLRYGVGNDYFSYERIFNQLNEWRMLRPFIYRVGQATPVESGYALLILVTKLFSDSYLFFVFVFAVVSIVSKYVVFKRLSPYLALSFLIYFVDEWFWKDLSGARTSLAAVFVLWSALFIYERQPWKFLLTAYCGILFHSAALVILPFYFLSRLLSRRPLMILGLGISVLIASSGGVGVRVVRVLNQLGVDDSSRLVGYIGSNYMGSGEFLRGTNVMHLIMSSLFIGFYPRLRREWKYNRVLVPMYVYGTIVMFLFFDYGIVWGRVRELVAVSASVVVIPSFLLAFPKRERFIPLFGVFGYAVLWLYLMTADRVPYRSILTAFL